MTKIWLALLLFLPNISIATGQNIALEKVRNDKVQIESVLKEYLSPKDFSQTEVIPNINNTESSKNQNLVSNSTDISYLDGILSQPSILKIEINKNVATGTVKNIFNIEGSALFKSTTLIRKVKLVKGPDGWTIINSFFPEIEDFMGNKIDLRDKSRFWLTKQLASTDAIDKFQKSTDKTTIFACSNSGTKEDCNYINEKKSVITKINGLKEQDLSAFAVWRLKENSKFLDEYKKTGDSDFLKAGIEDSINIFDTYTKKPAECKTDNVEIRIHARKDGQDIPNGYTVKWTMTDWLVNFKGDKSKLEKRLMIFILGQASVAKKTFQRCSKITFWSQDGKGKTGENLPLLLEDGDTDIPLPQEP